MSNIGIYGVKPYIDRARSFIAAGDEYSLRHACLELRFCLESIVYTRLSQLGEVLPRSVYRAWQPQKALKLLLSFEPRADQDLTLSIRVDREDRDSSEMPSGWQHIGDYKMFSVKWLNKSYSKLGKFLHLTSLQESDNPPELKPSDLQGILDEIDRVSTATMVSAINSITTVTCEVCKSDMFVSASQIDEGAVVECYNDNCGAKHKISKIDDDRFGTQRIGLQPVPCKSCGEKFSINGLQHNYLKDCLSCGQTHIVGWGYAKWSSAQPS